MTIAAYTGLTGSGKSYNVVEQIIIPAIKAGRTIVHNFQLREEVLKEVAAVEQLPPIIHLDKDVKPDELLQKCTPGAIICLDECWRYWPAGLTASDLPEDQRSFFAEHRHRTGTDGKSTEIVLICQDLNQLCKYVRELVQVTYRHEKLDKVGAKNRFRVDIYSGAATGQKPPKSSLLRQTYGTYKKPIQACYVSQTMSQTGQHGDEDNPDKRANLLRGSLPKITAAALICIAVAIWGARRSVDHLAHGNTAQQGQAMAPVAPILRPVPPGPVPATVAAPVPVAVKPVKTGPDRSSKWRLIGVATRHDGSGVAYLASSIAHRRINADTCKLTKAPADYECLVDGELVTQWTGEVAYASAALPQGALPTVSEPTAH